MIFESFKYKKNKTQAIIGQGITIDSFGDQFKYYTNKYYASLDNIENPLSDPIELANFNEKINEIHK